MKKNLQMNYNRYLGIGLVSLFVVLFVSFLVSAVQTSLEVLNANYRYKLCNHYNEFASLEMDVDTRRALQTLRLSVGECYLAENIRMWKTEWKERKIEGKPNEPYRLITLQIYLHEKILSLHKHYEEKAADF